MTTDSDTPRGAWAGYTNIKALNDALQDALAENVPVVLPGYDVVVLSDVLLLELVANGVEVGGYTVLRLDGRVPGSSRSQITCRTGRHEFFSASV